MSEYSNLEQKFLEAMEKTHQEINKHIEKAKEELKLAEKISEEQGIPFSSSVSDFCDRIYFPESFYQKWKEKEDDESDLYELLCDENLAASDTGWEYWRSSSLTC